MQSFEAFHASQERQRAREKLEKTQQHENNSAHTISNNVIKPATWRDLLGQKLEMYEVQFGIAILIYIDLVACTIYHVMESSSDIDMHGMPGSNQSYDSGGGGIVLRMLSSVLNFTMFGFILEIGALIYSFGSSFFSHYGYSMDLIIVSAIMYDNVYDLDLFPMRFLGLLRVWRVARLVVTVVNRVQEEHNITKTKLIQSGEEMSRANVDLKRLEENCKSEVDLRKQVERMLQGYKDEVDTLNEALQIAAMDVAGVARKEMDTHERTMKDTIDEGKYHFDQEGDKFYDGGEELKDQANRRVIVNKDGSFELS